MNQFEEKFTTEANNEFKNPQNTTKHAKQDMIDFRASVASGSFAQEGFHMLTTKGDIRNLQRYFFDNLLVHPNSPVVIAWSKDCDIP